ncbi:hypothetical protein ABMA28_006626 [Loxostege sticticalis]|uniref:Uncharacterized protein n=1 Tax=Loxostege sticticalis TaxID=481309 RepID=A0ABD0SNG3_LOXSC
MDLVGSLALVGVGATLAVLHLGSCQCLPSPACWAISAIYCVLYIFQLCCRAVAASRWSRRQPICAFIARVWASTVSTLGR